MLTARHVVAGLTGVPVYLAMVNGLHFACAWAGIQDLTWPHTGLVVWVLRAAGACAAAGMSLLTYRCAATWPDARRKWASIAGVLVFLALCPFFFLGCVVFGSVDTDFCIVGRDTVNGRLPQGLDLPPTASEVRMLAHGGIDPTTYLCFRVDEEDGRAFVRRARSYMEDNGLARADHPRIPRIGKWWWTPSESAAWVHRIDEGVDEGLFVQWDEASRRVYLRWWID